MYMSAVISLHQVFHACGYQRWTVQSQSDTNITAENSLLCTCSIKGYLHMFLHHMYTGGILCCIADIILQGPVSILCWDLLVRVLYPQCLSRLIMLSALSSDLVKTLLESLMTTELMITELSIKFAKLMK